MQAFITKLYPTQLQRVAALHIILGTLGKEGNVFSRIRRVLTRGGTSMIYANVVQDYANDVRVLTGRLRTLEMRSWVE